MAREMMLSAADEARLLGKSESTISRARQDPTHPVHGPNGITRQRGTLPSLEAPEGEIRDWWATQPTRTAGRPRIHPQPPPGWTLKTWRGLQAIANGEAVSGRMLAILTDKGAAADGNITDAGRALLAEHMETTNA